MTWIQHAGTAKEAYEQARRLDPEAQLSVSKVGEGRYLVRTQYAAGRSGGSLVHTYTESVKAPATKTETVSKQTLAQVSPEYKTEEAAQVASEKIAAQKSVHSTRVEQRGDKYVVVGIYTGPASNLQQPWQTRVQQDLESRGYAVIAGRKYTKEEIEPATPTTATSPIYRDPKTGISYRVDPSKLDSDVKIYETIGGERVRVDYLEVKPPGPFKAEHWVPYQQWRVAEFEKKHGGDVLKHESMMRARISRIVNVGLTPEEKTRLFAPTGSREFERSLMQHIEPYTTREYFGGPATLSTPFKVATATGAKISEWGVKTFTTIGHNIEVSVRPELYKATGQIVQSGALPFMAGEIAGQTMEYATRHPGEFVGQAATSALIFYGAGKVAGRTKAFVQEKIGPRVAMATKGRHMGSLVREYKSFKVTDYARAGIQKEIIGKGSPAYYVEKTHTRLVHGRVRFSMDQFKTMIKTPGRSLRVFYEKAKAYRYAGAEYQRFGGTPGTVKRTVYTYVKETPPKGMLYQYDAATRHWTIRALGGRKAHIRTYHPIPEDVYVPAIAGRYDVIRDAYGKKSIEYGGFDVLLKKPPKTAPSDPWIYIRGHKPGPMKPFSPPTDTVAKATTASRSSMTRAGTKTLDVTQLRIPDQVPVPLEAMFDYGTMYTVAVGSLTKFPELGPTSFGKLGEIQVTDLEQKYGPKFRQFSPEKIRIDLRTKDLPVLKQFEDVDVKYIQTSAMASRQVPVQRSAQAQRYAYEQVVAQKIKASQIPVVPMPVVTTKTAIKPVVYPKELKFVKKKKGPLFGPEHGYWVHPVMDPLAEIWGE